MIKIVSWDWRGGLTPETLAAAINAFDGGSVYARVPDAGDDTYILVLSSYQLDAAAALEAWEKSAT
jgi:hypothetical protein